MKPYLYFIIIFFLLVGLIGYFLIWPAYQQFTTVQSEIVSVQERIQTADDNVAELKKTSERLKEYESQIKILDSALPAKFYLPHLHYFFEEICPKYGLILDSMSANLNPLSDLSNIKEIPITLSLSGSYSSLKEFVAYLENSVRFFALQNVSLSGSDLPEEPFSLNLSLKTFTR